MLRITLTAILTLLTFGATAQSLVDQGLVDRVIAVVNDDVVLASELSTTVQSYQAQADRSLSPAELEQLSYEVFKQMVMTRVLVQEAERRGLEVTYRELEEAVNQQLTQARAMYPSGEEFRAALAEINLNEAMLEDMYRTEARDQMLINQLMTEQYNHRINITEEEIDEYLEEHELTGEQRTVFKLRIVSARELPGGETEDAVFEQARELAERARAGEDFLELAETYGEVKGDMGIRRLGELTPAFEQVAFALEQGQVSDPVRTSYGIHVIKVLERIDDETAHLAQIQLSIEAGEADRQRALDALAAARELLVDDPAAVVELPEYTDILEVQTVKLNQSELQANDPLLASQLAEMESGGLTTDRPYEGALSFMQLLDSYQTSAGDRERVRQIILDGKMQREREKWVVELVSEAYVDVKDAEFRGILPEGPGTR